MTFRICVQYVLSDYNTEDLEDFQFQAYLCCLFAGFLMYF